MSGAAARPTPARPTPLLQWILWAVLLMVLGGLAVVWFMASPPVAATPPPVLGEIGPFSLVDLVGAPVSGAELAGRPWVADAIFTRCALSCPMMTSRMRALGSRLPKGVRRVSITVDPEHDTPDVLADFAGSYGVTAADDWLFLTGSRDQIYGLVMGGMKLGISETPVEDPSREQEPITHSSRFVLLDGEGRVRGYYDAFDPASVDQLVRDVQALVG